MEIYYLENSAFAVFLKNSLLVFDYFMDSPVGSQRNVFGGVIGKEDLLKKEKVFVFASHIHSDHFNPVIFDWQQINPNTTYFLDSAIKERLRQPLQNAYFMQKGGTAEHDGLRAKAFGSTDEGISFYLEAEGLKIFHAGDLNFWHWRDESDEAYVAEAKRAFLAEMQDIIKDVPGLDIAFFPVDPIMGQGYDDGAVYFAETMKPALFIPMHCRGSLDTFDTFKQKMLGKTQVWAYHGRAEKISL